MVIGEAMGARVPVVVSDVCGAAREVSAQAGSVLPLSAPPEQWADAVDRQLMRTTPVPGYERSWMLVAREYEAVYATQGGGGGTERLGPSGSVGRKLP